MTHLFTNSLSFLAMLFVVFGFSSSFAQDSDLPEITLYMDSQYADIDSQIDPVGMKKRLKIATDFLDSLPLKYNIRQLNWNRAMRNLGHENNALIFDIIRSPMRDPLYHWIIPISEEEENILRLVSRKDPNLMLTPEGIKKGNFTGVCFINSAHCEYLRDLGVRRENITQLSQITPGQAEDMVQRGRVDFMLIYENEFLEGIKAANLKEDDFQYIMEVANEMVYVAAPLHIKPELLKILQAGVNP